MSDLDAVASAATTVHSAVKQARSAAGQAQSKAKSSASTFAALGLEGISSALTIVAEKLESIVAQHNTAAVAVECALNALATVDDGAQVSVTLDHLDEAVDKLGDAATALQAGAAAADEASGQAQHIEQQGTIAQALATVRAAHHAQSAVNAAVTATSEYRRQVHQRAAATSPSSGVTGPAPGTRPVSTLTTHGVTHGTVQRRAGATEGPVIFSAFKGASPVETGQAQEYVDAANKAHSQGKLSPTGRASFNRKESMAKERAAARERERADRAGKPYGDAVAAHLPDSTWLGRPEPPGWGRHTKRVNSSLGGQSSKYPTGYKPSTFQLDDSWPEPN